MNQAKHLEILFVHSIEQRETLKDVPQTKQPKDQCFLLLKKYKAHIIPSVYFMHTFIFFSLQQSYHHVSFFFSRRYYPAWTQVSTNSFSFIDDTTKQASFFVKNLLSKYGHPHTVYVLHGALKKDAIKIRSTRLGDMIPPVCVWIQNEGSFFTHFLHTFLYQQTPTDANPREHHNKLSPLVNTDVWEMSQSHRSQTVKIKSVWILRYKQWTHSHSTTITFAH